MKLLIIEDSELKRESVKAALYNAFPNLIIHEAKNYFEAVEFIESDLERIDCILLDMSLPTHTKGLRESESAPNMYAGRDLLAKMAFLGIEKPTIIITMYEDFQSEDKMQTFLDLENELVSDFTFLKGMIKYKANTNLWSEKLIQLLKGIN